METDADRLASIKAAGGVLVQFDTGISWAIFDREFIATDIGLQIEGRVPVLTCRSSDLGGLAKDTVIAVAGTDYRVKRLEPDIPAPGWTTVLLRI